MEPPKANIKAFEDIAKSLETMGWAVSDEFLPARLASELNRRILELQDNAQLVPANIGRVNGQHRNPTRRGDQIFWIEENAAVPCEKSLLQRIDQLQDFFRSRLFMPLSNREFHFALYPENAFYEKHRDQHIGSQSRVISCVFYLNENWSPADGGILRIFDENSPEKIATEVEPVFGRSVFFLSDKIFHEVLKSFKERKSVTGWLRR